MGAAHGRIATGGIGTMSVGNVLFEGKPMGMLYEKNADGENYKTATLVVGNSMGPASILGRSTVPALKSGAAGSEHEGRLRVFFESNRHGKWRPVVVPKGKCALASICTVGARMCALLAAAGCNMRVADPCAGVCGPMRQHADMRLRACTHVLCAASMRDVARCACHPALRVHTVLAKPPCARFVWGVCDVLTTRRLLRVYLCTHTHARTRTHARMHARS